MVYRNLTDNEISVLQNNNCWAADSRTLYSMATLNLVLWKKLWR